MKKIMFSDAYQLTQAVLDGRKTQTRRIVPQSTIDKYSLMEDFTIIDDARYNVGEVVAVAQSYESLFHGTKSPNDFLLDDSNMNPKYCGAGFKNKMFVRADLMPHRIRITNVRVERLQDISDDDCLAEGVLHSDKYAMPYGIPDSKAPNGVDFYYSTPREAYAALIDKISGKGTFESNPYVFVYEFELVK